MKGKELDGLSLKELQHLEKQLSEGILAVKDRKNNLQGPGYRYRVLLALFISFSFHNTASKELEQKAMMENEILRKQVVNTRLWSSEERMENRTLQRLRESSGFTVTFLY
ncbi:hypothetical protein V8G54_028281 [Vigna mungo]|uniref:K-box domain-containing protein n=1 Tax=Vigna mungo TaxID=3915 RepID=A0AAQ3RLJ4_VIGMU